MVGNSRENFFLNRKTEENRPKYREHRRRMKQPCILKLVITTKVMWEDRGKDGVTYKTKTV
jgi:hypothetical protein